MARSTGIQIQFKPILPNTINTTMVLTQLTSGVKEAAEMAEQKYFAQSYSTWRHKPKWTIKLKSRKNDIVARLATSSKPFTYVELGTLSGGRWRRMSKNFISKTNPGRLGSAPGAGKAEGFFTHPVRGLRPRNFRVIVAKRMQPEFQRIMTKRMAIIGSVFFTGPKLSGLSFGVGTFGG
jgi:hypothetical protein